MSLGTPCRAESRQAPPVPFKIGQGTVEADLPQPDTS
jgi:hypothetical protein